MSYLYFWTSSAYSFSFSFMFVHCFSLEGLKIDKCKMTKFLNAVFLCLILRISFTVVLAGIFNFFTFFLKILHYSWIYLECIPSSSCVVCTRERCYFGYINSNPVCLPVYVPSMSGIVPPGGRCPPNPDPPTPSTTSTTSNPFTSMVPPFPTPPSPPSELKAGIIASNSTAFS